LLRRDKKWYKPAGTTATTHIFKPQIGRLPNGIDLSNSVENEYFCLKLVSALGVQTANAEIDDFGPRRTLIVERFDRRWTSDGRLIRLPQEDCLQALSIPPTRKYQSDGGPDVNAIFRLLKGSDIPDDNLAAFMRANIIFWLIGATDGHAKNFSIFLSPGGRFRMTPLYDVLSAQPSLDAKQIQRKTFKLAMSVGKSRHYEVAEILPRHFFQTADLAGIESSLVTSIFDDLTNNAARASETVVKDLPEGFPQAMLDSILTALAHRIELIKAG